MDDSYGLYKLQKASLAVLKCIDDICISQGIKYMLDAGTLIGCVRHGGFIPWDDDIDIAMTRDEWEKFRAFAPSMLPSDMYLLEPDDFCDGTRFYDFTARVIYRKSRRKDVDAESTFYEEKLNHIWVDIFILDELPDVGIKRQVLLLKQKIIYMLAMGHRWTFDIKKYPMHYKVLLLVGSTIGRLVPMKKLFALQDRLSRKYNGMGGEYAYYSNYQPDYLYVTLRQKWCSELIRSDFEDIKVYISQYYDDILKEVYGDYMTLPPEGERVPTHGSKEIEIYE